MNKKRKILTVVALALFGGIATAEQPSPAFELFDALLGPNQSLTWNFKQPLLSVSKIKSIRLDSEGDYLLTLTDSDAKKLAQITEERAGKFLIVVSEGEFVAVFRIREPIVGGVMCIYHTPDASPTLDHAFVEKLKKRQE